ncbi:MAG: hypothetical protein AAF664_25490 [Planctomycetota bacterium]
MDELRIRIWDALYKEEAALTFGELSAKTGVEEAEIIEAVEHCWFEVQDSSVQIAESP